MDILQFNTSFQLIIETTETLIKEKGCRKTTLQEIINRTGLSKGAIYHYVQSKDELFGVILKARMSSINEQFNQIVQSNSAISLTGPVDVISNGLSQTAEQDVTNTIFIYLLSQQDNPAIQMILKDVYEFALEKSMKWIEIGQQHGVIPQELDKKKTAALFITFSYGQRVQSLISHERVLEQKDIFNMIFRTLQNK